MNNTTVNSNVQIYCSNVMGLGFHNSNRFHLNRVPFKIKEMISACKHVNTIFFAMETKLKSFHRQIKLPRGYKYVGETSCDSASGGIYVFMSNCFTIENKARDVRVIYSKHAMFVRVKIGSEYLNLISVYLPSSKDETKKIMQEIDSFIETNNITKFSFFGDTNCDFKQPKHFSNALIISAFFEKYNLYNLAEKLNVDPGYTWRGRGGRMNSKSLIDHFFTNSDCFNKIEFSHSSFSDHKHIKVSNKQKYVYHPPKWQSYLFSNNEFVDLMKKETLKFLVENADVNSITKSKEIYLNSPDLIDCEFLYENIEHNHSGAMFNLIEHLKRIHDKFYSNLKLKAFQKTKDFEQQINSLYNKVDLQNCDDAKKEINLLISTQQDFFKKLVQSSSETYQMRKLISDGNPNTFTYQNFKASKQHEHNLLVNNELINCPNKIAEIFGKVHANLVSPDIMPNSNLNDLLETFDLKLDEMFPKITSLTSPYSTTSEFKKVIKSMKSNSAPGPSSQPKQLFSFLIDILPKFTTNALNNLYNIDLDNSSLSFLKLRNVIFLPKPGLDQTIAENNRPIALLEVPYKIVDKALNKKISPLLHKICHSDQHGFIEKKQMANATLSITATMNHIKAHDLECQLIFFDLQKAYDKALNCISNKILKQIFPCGNFADAFISLTNGGKFKVTVKNASSRIYENKIGLAQGAPSSGSRFNIYNHIFYCCLTSPKIKALTLSIAGNTLKPVCFADDGFSAFRLKSSNDVSVVSSMLQKLETTINMKINFTKTKILTNGDHPPNLHLLGTPCEYVKHLGIYLSFNNKKANDLSYNELFEKLKVKTNKLSFLYSDNIFKRRNICFSLLNTMAFHIFRVHSINTSQSKMLFKSMAKFLWSNKTIDGTSSRHKVAKNRIELDFCNGGLNMLLPTHQSFIIWLTSFFQMIKHAYQFPDSNIALILEYKHVPIKNIFGNLGSESFKKYMPKFKSLYPQSSEGMFKKTLIFLRQLERNPKTFLHSTITTSYWSRSVTFSREDNFELKQTGLETIASVLHFIKLEHKIIYLPMINPNIKDLLSEKPVLYTKLTRVVKNICNEFQFNTLSCISKSKQNFILKPLIKLFEDSPKIFSFHFKHFLKEKNQKVPPAVKTRKNENKYFPDWEVFKNSFNRLLALPITLYYKGFLFEQLNRTLISRNKLYHMNIIDSNECIKCKNVIADSDHAIYQCYFPRYFAHCLALFLDRHYNNSCPDFIHLKENFYLFNIFYECFTLSDYTQISLLILIAKERALKISKDECLNRYNDYNCYAQSLFISQFASKLINNTGLSSNLIDKFIEFILIYDKDVTHFRTT